MKIGLVVNVLDEEYQISIFRGIRKQAKKLGVDIFCIQQGNSKTTKNSLFSKFHTQEFFDLDGIIILNSVMTDSYSFASSEDVKKLWGDLPVIAIGQQIQDVPSLLVQTDYSMKQLVEHLITEHKYKRFVFLGGPQNHHDAIRRKEIFFKTLEAYKPWYSDLSCISKNGAFSEGAGFRMMSELYNEYPDFNPDVVVCSTDNMAIGVYKFFKMNKDNPKIRECAVTGFDDIPQSRYEVPSITTVRQPLEEMGEMAINQIVDLVNGKKLPELSFIESSVILRESCGCHKEEKMIPNDKYLLSDLQSKYIFSEQMLRITTHFEQDLNDAASRGLVRYFIDSNIANLDIQNFSILLMYKDNDELLFEPFYVKKNGRTIDPFNGYQKMHFKEFLEQYYHYKTESNKPLNTLISRYLVANNVVFGVVLYDCKISITTYLSSIIVSIAQAISRILSNEELHKYSKHLEEEVEKRTHELIEANNKRMEVEAEVLHISELERQRFSNDLHDDICQRLAGISMLCRSYSNQTKPVEKDQMIELAQLISDTLTTTRQYAHNSYPVELESLGLNYALSNLCNTFATQMNINCEYEWKLDENIQFTSLQKLNVFRIIQEALHNIMKHAHAKNVLVKLELNQNKDVDINICDDGCGMPESEENKKQGIGVNSMKYRANQIDAFFQIKKNEPSGTCVNVLLKNENLVQS